MLEGVTAIFARHYGQLVRRDLIGTDSDATPPVTEDNTARTNSDGKRQYLHCWSTLNSTRMRSCSKNSGSRRCAATSRSSGQESVAEQTVHVYSVSMEKMQILFPKPQLDRLRRLADARDRPLRLRVSELNRLNAAPEFP